MVFTERSSGQKGSVRKIMAKVLISERMHPVAEEVLREAGHEVVWMPSIEMDVFREYIKDCDALLNRILPVTAEMMASNPKLKIISKHGVGIDNFDLEAAKEQGIMITTAPGANSQSVAEHSFALMIALAKNLIPISSGYREVGFGIKNTCEGVELMGKTIGIIGCGRIGSRMAKMCRNGFDMRVLVYDPYITDVPEGCELTSDRDRIFREADFVSLHCYLSEETRNCVGEHEFSIMKPSCILVNCARGPVVDEPAMIKALPEKRLAGAGLDVTWDEPLPKESPLFAMDNVICTPHYAPTTHDAAYNVARMAAENIANYFAGKPVVGRVV